MYTREIHIEIKKKKKIPTNVQWSLTCFEAKSVIVVSILGPNNNSL